MYEIFKKNILNFLMSYEKSSYTLIALKHPKILKMPKVALKLKINEKNNMLGQ